MQTVDGLERLAALFESGAITPEEYDKAKQCLLQEAQWSPPVQDEEPPEPRFKLKYILLTIALIAGLAMFAYSRPGMFAQDKEDAATAATKTAGSRERAVQLGKDMVAFALERAASEQSSAAADRAQETAAHMEKWNFNITTGQAVIAKRTAENAILQRSIDRLERAKILIQSTTGIGDALEEIERKDLKGEAETEVAYADLNAAIRKALKHYRGSPIVSRNERLRFEKRFKEAS